MKQRFSQDSFSQAARGHYDEPQKPLWRRVLPLFIVLCAGALAFYFGKTVTAHLTKNFAEIEPVPTNPSVMEHAVIGGENPEIMAPRPTLPPLSNTTSIQKPAKKQDTPKVPTSPKTTPKPAITNGPCGAVWKVWNWN